MKQSFASKYRKEISLILALVLATGIVGASYKSWYASDINVSFNIVTNKDIVCKVFYTVSKTADFKESEAVKRIIKNGTSDAKFVLPVSKLAKIRIGFGNRPGVVNLSKLRINANKIIKLKSFADYEYKNMDSTEVMPDGSVTVVSDQDNPYIGINQTFDVGRGYDINWLKVVAFFSSVFVTFYAFFMLALYKKKKKKKEFFDYY